MRSATYQLIVILFLLLTIALWLAVRANAQELKPKVLNADEAPKQATPPTLSAAEVEKYWIKEAKYQKLFANALVAEKERDAQTEVLKGMCGKFAVLMFDPTTDKIYCK